MIRIPIIIGALLFLGACSTIPQGAAISAAASTVRASIKNDGAKAADQVLKNSIWVVCQGSSVGAVKRYFKTKELADAWLAICDDSATDSVMR